ncbi:AMP-binding protein [Allokutzneria albata]|uniref:Acyl-CoA synthetase (AMP-forming)/AMP-acid ligase II n=1 Tax=Allokutzneria albata TaxID=211114 RepID=A0A1H0A8W6_ALLAB|nr:AMP-binding protein [Allokutzneria albata]SDN29664.1 Acyl-CoA synthetase (AMP-forming)/AMP-acid ligase II [Allokutzneria albata]
MSSPLVADGARLIDAPTGTELGGAELQARVTVVAGELTALPAGAILALTAVDLPSTLRYLGAFQAQRAVAVLAPDLDPEPLNDLVERFQPAAVLGVEPGVPVPGGYASADLTGPAWVRADGDGVEPHPDLAVLLPTSGSTGNPKLVRLSRTAVLSNARAIAQALRLDSREIAPTSLPLHYAYGLSVLNSHLVVGAAVLIEPNGVTAPSFWRAVDEHRATSLAGVPYHYELLHQADFDPAAHPALRTLTQAGGRLRTDRLTHFARRIEAVGGRMYVMYGQTEATTRMAVLPAERLAAKIGSVGQALPGAEFGIRPLPGEPPQAQGEVVYRGPNVMMGYAENAAELAGPDELRGELATGDLGYLDDEGFLFITGRLSRIGKVFGNRVNLDDLEHLLRGHGLAAAVPGDEDRVVIWLEDADAESCTAAAKELAERLHLHVSGFRVRPVERLPLLPSGKIDYRALEGR